MAYLNQNYLSGLIAMSFSGRQIHTFFTEVNFWKVEKCVHFYFKLYVNIFELQKSVCNAKILYNA